MNLFKGTGDLAQGMMRMMNNNNWNATNQKENKLKKNLETCTYPDQTKYMIEKAIKQVFHVYPFFDAQILMFTENGFQRRYIELKGIMEVQIKGKTCKVDYNMMLPNDYPRTPPFVRIINRNLQYRVDPFYQKLQSKTDKTSYILNEKLNSVKNWHPSNSLVNVLIECYQLMKTKFPFTKPPAQNVGGMGAMGANNNPWDKLYNKGANNNPNPNFGGGGFNQGNQANWPPQTANNNWPQTGNNNWPQNNNQNNNWGNQGAWGGQPSKGGMGGIIGGGGTGAVMGGGGMGGGGNVMGNIAAGQQLVAKQKKTLSTLNNNYSMLIAKNQELDLLRQSLQSEQSWLRRQNFQMANFLRDNESIKISDLTSIVKPSNEASQQILQLSAGIKAREDCLFMLESKFNDEEIKLQEFMKQLRKIEEARFEEKVLLQKCIHHGR